MTPPSSSTHFLRPNLKPDKGKYIDKKLAPRVSIEQGGWGFRGSADNVHRISAFKKKIVPNHVVFVYLLIMATMGLEFNNRNNRVSIFLNEHSEKNILVNSLVSLLSNFSHCKDCNRFGEIDPYKIKYAFGQSAFAFSQV